MQGLIQRPMEFEDQHIPDLQFDTVCKKCKICHPSSCLTMTSLKHTEKIYHFLFAKDDNKISHSTHKEVRENTAIFVTNKTQVLSD